MALAISKIIQALKSTCLPMYPEVPDDADQAKLGAGTGRSKKGNQNKHLSETEFTAGYTFLGTPILGTCDRKVKPD